MSLDTDWPPLKCALQPYPEIELASLDEEVLLYHPWRRTAFALNTTAASIWALCDGQRTLREIVDQLAREYPEAGTHLARDVGESVLTLFEHGALFAPRGGPSAAAYAISFGRTSIRLEADNDACARILHFLCADMAVDTSRTAATTFRLGRGPRAGTIAAYRDDVLLFTNSSDRLVVAIFLERVLDYLIESCTGGMLLHAGAVAREGRALVVAGKTGAGKTTLTTRLIQRGFDYLSEELVWIDSATMSLQGFARPLHVKESAVHLYRGLVDLDGDAAVKVASGYQISPRGLGARAVSSARPAGLVFPTYRANARFDFHPISRAQAATRLIASVVNAGSYLPGGLDEVAGLVRAVPAFAVTYSNAEQAAERLDTLLSRA